jgi:hypothetical protein
MSTNNKKWLTKNAREIEAEKESINPVGMVLI